MSIEQAIIEDLQASGLTPEDIRARPATGVELAATNTNASCTGYVIPYFRADGITAPFYRVKLFDSEPKYKQPTNSGNFVYFPKTFKTVFDRVAAASSRPFLIITEGEKKAAAATKAGFPTVALGGVDSWRNRVVVLPGDTKLLAGTSGTGGKDKIIKAKLPGSSMILPEVTTLATGMKELMDLAVTHNANVFIIYDTDRVQGLKPDVQRAAAMLGYEMRYHGISTDRIRLVTLPSHERKSKMGLDDFLMLFGPKKLLELLETNLKMRRCFPRHPNPRAFVNNRLENGRLGRKETQEVALSIMTELDARGMRLRDTGTSAPYFFDEESLKLMPAQLLNRAGTPLHESQFGQFMYQTFGVSSADNRMMAWLAAQFTGEQPVDEVSPRRIVTKLPEDSGFGDGIAYQLSDSHFIVVTGNPEKPFTVCTNGRGKLLFEQGQVEPLDREKLEAELQKQMQEPLEPKWRQVFEDVSVADPVSRDLCTLLYYVSPWINRWRHTQLPVEIVCGEPGSGKSSLQGLRLAIMTGRPILRNAPSDIRDWHAAISNSGGLHVTDNVQMTNKDMRQKLSDEVCRLVTEPEPHVEMRQLYTTADQVNFPVHSTFVFTAVKQPFQNPDIIQRAAILELKSVDRTPDGDWIWNKINQFGGREAWVAHHLIVLHKFFALADDKELWESRAKVKHRLAHYEQSLRVMSQVFGLDDGWIGDKLSTQMQTNLSDADWALEGLKAFAEDVRGSKGKTWLFSSQDIANWSISQEEFQDNPQLTNSRRLGRYLTANAFMVEQNCKIRDMGMRSNRRVYRVTE
jgi:hypothetical protein